MFHKHKITVSQIKSQCEAGAHQTCGIQVNYRLCTPQHLNEPEARVTWANQPMIRNFIAYREVALVAKMNGKERRS